MNVGRDKMPDFQPKAKYSGKIMQLSRGNRSENIFNKYYIV